MSERDDLITALQQQRYLLTKSLDGVSDTDAARRTTVSELCLGGVVKHVARAEAQWVDFIGRGASAMGAFDDAAVAAEWMAAFRMSPGETVEGIVAEYRAVGDATDDVLRTADLDLCRPLPVAPWFAPGAEWSTRRVALHILAEIAQHAGHADIVREALDGTKSMG